MSPAAQQRGLVQGLTAAPGSRTHESAVYLEEFKAIRRRAADWRNPLATDMLTMSRHLHNTHSENSTEDAKKHLDAVKIAFPPLTNTDLGLALKNPYADHFKNCFTEGTNPAYAELARGMQGLLAAAQITSVRLRLKNIFRLNIMIIIELKPTLIRYK